jgi:hypothetical protein
MSTAHRMKTQLDNKHGQRALLVVAFIACAALVALAHSAATPAAGAASRTIIFTLSDAGKGRWSIVSANERGSVAMNYNWHGNLRFKVPAAVLANPNKRFSIPSSTTLLAGWIGDSTGTRAEPPNQGPYHCSYKGTNVRGIVTAVLTNGTARGTMQIVLAEKGEDGFFPSDGHGATVSCSNAQGASGPSHFEPQWLFRDSFSDHGQLTSGTAIFALPTNLLPKGSAKLAFPKEVGQIRKNPLLGDFTWDNRGTLRVSSRPV